MNINNDDINNGDNTSCGVRSRFRDRLNKINKKLKNKKNDEDESIIKSGSRNILKIFLALPSVVYSVVKIKDSSLNKDGIKKYNSVKDTNRLELHNFSNDKTDEIRRKKIEEIKKINVSLIKKKYQKNEQVQQNNNQIQNKDTNNIQYNINNDVSAVDNVNNYQQKTSTVHNSKNIKNASVISNNDNITSDKVINENLNEKELRINKLQKEIIDLIKKKLVNNINELEMLQSELYLLNELDMGDIYLKDCQEDIKEIKKLLSKVKSLKEKYDYLKENVDFEYMLEYADDLLIDKILELKTICSSDDIKCLVDNYKILDEYKYLYLKIDKLQENTIKYQEHKELKVEELKHRDIDFEKLKSEVYDIDRENSRYDNFVKEQELFLDELNRKVSQIDSRERVTYNLKGFNQLLGNSFKYLGLLLLNPLKGFIPGIATQTLITKNIVHNLYRNLDWEENRKMVYEAIDYSSAINNAINDLDLTASMIDTSLDDIVRLKEKYNKEFAKYGGSISSYRDAIRKINKIENAILGSKIKVEKMQIRMREKEKENSDKLKRVKKLNTSSNS